MRLHVLQAAATIAMFSAGWVHAGYGDVDTTFAPFTGGCNMVAALEDGGAYVDSPNDTGLSVTRLKASGAVDTTWANGGTLSYPAPQYSRVRQVLRGKAGDIYVTSATTVGTSGTIVHILANGTLDASFGNGGQVLTFPLHSAALQGDGKIVVLSVANGATTFARYTAQGKTDFTFSNDGVTDLQEAYNFTVPNAFSILGWAIRDDGLPEILVYGPSTGNVYEPRLFKANTDFSLTQVQGRVVPQGLVTWMSDVAKVEPTGALVVATPVTPGVRRFFSDGTADASFAPDFHGVNISSFSGLWREPDGHWTVLGAGMDSSGFFFIYDNLLRAMRLDAAGHVDATFGLVQFPGPVTIFSQPLAHAADGSILVASGNGTCTLQRYVTGAPRTENLIVEYYAPALDHYFMTSTAGEILLLDSDPTYGFVRTGESFGSWAPGSLAGASHVCRFYGDYVIGPNSHFYTSDPGECAYLISLDAATPKGQPAWHLEAKPFDMAIPGSAGCPSGLQPVYRAYNGLVTGQGNGPNHRYTTDPAIYAAMQAKGWYGEGVRFCAPPRVETSPSG
jgi:Repeat of unknown function (DUF5648)